MKVYTKTGDNGTTGLYDGSRVGKDSQILDVLGTLDELSSHIGVLLYHIRKEKMSRVLFQSHIIDFLIKVQKKLLDIGSIVATPNPTETTRLPTISESDINEIEMSIDTITRFLKPLTTFIIQTGVNMIEAQSHVCRTITRRAERELNKYGNVCQPTLIFMNRLSDWFFTVARFFSECEL